QRNQQNINHSVVIERMAKAGLYHLNVRLGVLVVELMADNPVAFRPSPG
ncbi:MAG: hypothetical protein JWR15_4185, partial [Prosthecobacter sp.]|nr:hypothetical protein [Prosthecobacter sp.]